MSELVNNGTLIVDRKKDKLLKYRNILETHPYLRESIINVFSSAPIVPSIHITSRAFKSRDGNDIVDSGFIQRIRKDGFRSRDTNVGVFMTRNGQRNLATSREFVDSPEKFLKELETLIRHYYHHGTRTNKNILGGNFNNYQGIPTMLIIDVSNVSLIPGTDYEDHYKLGSLLPGNAIIGEVDLENIGNKIDQELPKIALSFLNHLKSYIESNQSGQLAS